MRMNLVKDSERLKRFGFFLITVIRPEMAVDRLRGRWRQSQLNGLVR